MLRMVLPKKTNFEFLTQWDLRTIDREFGATLYLEEPHQSNENISWNWLLNEFAEQPFYTFKSPKAVLLIEEISENIETNYAVTFGSSYFKIKGSGFRQTLIFVLMKTLTKNPQQLYCLYNQALKNFNYPKKIERRRNAVLTKTHRFL